MSKMIPRRTIDALRIQNDVSVDVWGIPCTLFIPNDLNAQQSGDIYHKDSQYTYDEYTSVVWVEWNPNQHRLRKFGLFSEKLIPILARFKKTAVSVATGLAVDVDVIMGSYIVVSIEYVPGKYQDTSEFEVVDTLIGATHDAVVAKIYKLAPRRVNT